MHVDLNKVDVGFDIFIKNYKDNSVHKKKNFIK